MRAWPRSAPILISLLSCSKPEETQPPVTTLPTETTPSLPSIPLEDTGTWVPMDTGGTVTNIEPEATVLIIQEGFWNLGPPGGPYDQLSGTLQVNEWPDGEIDTGNDTAPLDTATPPLCEVLFNVTGTAELKDTCPDCDIVFDVEWTVAEGDVGACRDPDLPLDGAHWHLGYVQATNTLKFNYYNSGVWVDWYETQQVLDTLHVLYDTTKAVAVEDDT